jgi:hypothetical protein
MARMCVLVAWAAISWGAARAQEPAGTTPQAPQPQPEALPMQEEVTTNPAGCVQPPPMVRIEDYDGPLKKVVGTFARPLERKSVPVDKYKPGTKLCTFKLKEKFLLFVQDSFDPVTFLSVGFDAGLDQAQNTAPSYGQGAEGYGRRFGAEYAGQVSSGFLKDFVYPTIFSEDPRYYRLAHGSAKKRFLHAMEHAVVAHRDDGKAMFNFSEWLGTASTIALSNTYYPDNKRGFAPAAERFVSDVLQDMGFDVLREFWPEVSKKFKLPFRGQSTGQPADPSPDTR